MANEQHVAIVKAGSHAVATWRNNNPNVRLDLQDADLGGVDLRNAELGNAILISTNLRAAKLQRANLMHANLSHAVLAGAQLYRAMLDSASLVYANLEGAALEHVDLGGADLRKANLRGADLRSAAMPRVDLSGADLTGANLFSIGLSHATLDKISLRRADLRTSQFTKVSMIDVDLSEADLRGTAWVETTLHGVTLQSSDLTGADFFRVTCVDVDLSEVRGLETIHHTGPSSIGLDTLRKSQGRIPDSFLRGCGLADWEIHFARLYSPGLGTESADLLVYELRNSRIGTAIQISPLFISYSHRDAEFVDALETNLNRSSIRFWRDIHDIKAGRVEKQLIKAISLNPTVLLVLSANSVDSDWVEWEVATAREIEKERNRDVLCPITLDQAWQACKCPGPLRRQVEDYHVLDFSRWREPASFTAQFQKLIDGLKLFYQS